MIMAKQKVKDYIIEALEHATDEQLARIAESVGEIVFLACPCECCKHRDNCDISNDCVDSLVETIQEGGENND